MEQQTANLSLGPERHSLVDFLRVMQEHNVYHLPLSPQAGLGIVGRGISGTIDQSTADVATMLTFKNGIPSHQIKDNNQHQDWRSLMTEVSILEHPSIKNNLHIINLVGISWKVDPQRLRAWPYIVTLKAVAGNLGDFLLQENIDTEIRLQICAEVAEAYELLHRCGIGHGDIKPQNILIDKDEAGTINCRVADFGSSAIRGQTRIPQGTPLWHAPELPVGQNRNVSTDAIVSSDFYSFGLLIAHILIPRAELSKAELWLLEPTENTGHKIRELYENDSLGKGLLAVAVQSKLPSSHQSALEIVLARALRKDADIRTVDWEALEAVLGPFISNSESTVVPLDTSRIISSSEAKVVCEHSVYDIIEALGELDDVDYVLHINISDDIASKAISLSCQECKRWYSSQLVTCYQVGFGLERDVQKCELWRNKANLTEEDTQSEIERLSSTYRPTGRLNEQVREALSIGVLVSSDRTEQYKLQRRLKKAEKSLLDALSAREVVFGPLSIINAKLKSELAKIYKAQSLLPEAEKYQQEVVAICTQKFGLEYPSTLAAKASLASILSDQGLLLDAEKIQRQIQPQFEAIDGKEHPETVTALQNLGVTLHLQSRYEEAAKIFGDVSSIRAKILSRTHPLTIGADICLTSAMLAQGLIEQANEMMVDIDRRSNEVRDPIIGAHVRMSQAMMYHHQGLSEDSEKAAMYAVKILQKKLTPDDPMFLQAQEILGLTYMGSGKLEEQEKLLRSILTAKTSLHRQDQSVLSMKAYLASNLYRQHRIKESMIEAQEVVDILKNSIGKDPENYLACINTLTSCLTLEGRRAEAEGLQKNLLDAYEDKLGQTHPLTLDARSHLADFYVTLGRFEVAEKLQKTNLDIRLKSEHRGRTTVRSARELASSYREQNRFTEAIELCEQAKKWSIESVGPSHGDTLAVEYSLAATYFDMGRTDEAASMYMAILQSEEITNQLKISVCDNLSSILNARGQVDDAVDIAEKALVVSSKVHGEHHPATIKLVGTIIAYKLSLQLTEELENIALENIQMKKTILGPRHFSTIKSMCALADAYSEHKRAKEAEVLYDEMESLDVKDVLQNQAIYATYCCKRANMFHHLGSFERAKDLEEEALQIRLDILPADHRAIQTSRRNLASTLTSMGKYSEAEDLVKAVITTRERILPLDAVATLQTKHDLASIMFLQDRFDESEELYNYILKAYLSKGAPTPIINQQISCIKKVRETRNALRGDSFARLEST